MGIIPPRTLALKSPFIVCTAISRWRKRPVNSSTVACLNGRSSREEMAVHPAAIRQRIAKNRWFAPGRLTVLCQHDIQRLSYFIDADQLHSLNRLELGE